MEKVSLKDIIEYIHSLDIKEYNYSLIKQIHDKFNINTNYSVYPDKENVVLRFSIRGSGRVYGFICNSVRISIEKDCIKVFINKTQYSFDNGYETTLLVLEHGRDILKLFESEVEIYFS